MDYLKLLEIELHQREIRKNTNRAKELLHQGFIEIGYSGRTYNFESMINSIAKMPSDYCIWSQNYEFAKYNSNVVQIIYLSDPWCIS